MRMAAAVEFPNITSQHDDVGALLFCLPMMKASHYGMAMVCSSKEHDLRHIKLVMHIMDPKSSTHSGFNLFQAIITPMEPASRGNVQKNGVYINRQSNTKMDERAGRG